MNLLTQRLKFAKRELTNLKTAHKRGLGNLKIYKTTTSPDNPPATFASVIIKVDFDTNYAPYPFAVLEVKITDPTASRRGNALSVDMYEYTNNGYSVEFRMFYWWVSATQTSEYSIVSTAPVTNISYTWEV